MKKKKDKKMSLFTCHFPDFLIKKIDGLVATDHFPSRSEAIRTFTLLGIGAYEGFINTHPSPNEIMANMIEIDKNIVEYMNKRLGVTIRTLNKQKNRLKKQTGETK